MSGSRPLAIFVIGAALVVLSLNNFVQIAKPSDTSHLKPSIVPSPKPNEYTVTSEASHPSYEGLHFLKDVRVVDLRSRIKVPKSKRLEEYSPVTLVRYSLLEKKSPDVETVEFEFGTTGTGLSPRCLTHESKKEMVTAQHFHGDVELAETWMVKVDVKKDQPGVPFMVINEATYWNAFKGEDDEWFSMNVPQETDVIAMILLFPQNKPIKDYDLYAYPHNGERKRFLESAVTFRSENHQVFVWKIEKPTVGYNYQVNWRW